MEQAKTTYLHFQLVFSIKEIRMRESSMANAKPPECNSISTTDEAVIDITKGGFNGVKLVRETSIPL